MNPMKAATAGPSIADIRACEKEGDAFFRKKQWSEAARKFGEAAMRYEKAGFGSMAAACESKRITAASNLRNGTEDRTSVEQLHRWAASKKK